MMFAMITPALITGAVMERMKFSALFIFLAIWSVIVYYPLAHMVWATDGLIGSVIGGIDFAGGLVVHISSGVSALVASLFVGRRMNTEAEPHNIPFVFLGASMLWFGWFGFNSGSALSAGYLAAHAFMTTNTAAASAMLSWMLIDQIRFGKPSLVGASTAFVVGLVAITPGAGFVSIWSSIIFGLLVSPICYTFVYVVKPKLGYDDTLDVFGCHGIGGIWGSIATGLFAQKKINPVTVRWDGLFFGEGKLFGAQLAGIGIAVPWSIVGTLIGLGIARILVGGLRTSPEDEKVGLDTALHGEAAYPAFSEPDFKEAPLNELDDTHQTSD
jgi:Amt family ammonium transporter